MTIRLSAGDPAPGFVLPDADDNLVSLADHAGEKVVLYFYPAAMTPGCTTQAADFTANLDTFTSRGYQVIGVSPDPSEALRQFREQIDIGFTLLGDPSLDVIKSYGAYGEKMLYGKPFEGVIRSTFVVDVAPDGAGRIELAQYDVRASGHVERLREQLCL